MCFEKTLETTLYSEHVLRGAHISAKEVTPGRPGFRTGRGFFSLSMLKKYSKSSQLALMITLLGSEVRRCDMIFQTSFFCEVDSNVMSAIESV